MESINLAPPCRVFIPPPSPPPRPILKELIFLRAFQQSTLSIALFIACYFVYWHLTLIDTIPPSLIIFIATTTLTLLLTTLHTLDHALFPLTSPPAPLLPTSLTTTALTTGYLSLFTLSPSLTSGDDWFKPIRENDGYATYHLKPAGVEDHHFVLRMCLLVIGGAGLLVSVGILGLAVAGREREVGEKKGGRGIWEWLSRGKNGGYRVVGEEGGEEDEECGMSERDEGGLKSL